ncbi:MAG TPA: AAA family ATPase [Polyangiaceae bacterium]|nr:AAA family ATPase [Polyangiaceae bacterium]
MPPEAELIGRAGPLELVRAALARARDGRGSLLLIRGEPGIGKSALAAHVAAEAAALGARVISGRAWELAEAPPYFPLWPALRDLGIPTPGGDGEAFQLWERVLAALAQACSAEPRVWVLEDVHAADLLSLDLLTFLAGPLRSLRALVVVTARAQDPRLTERAQQRFTRMLREGQEIALEPLAAAQIAELTARIAERPVPRATLHRLAELTGGNPLFVVECARALRGGRGVHGAALPQSVRQLILERVALLPEPTRRTLAACAILGREANAATVARVVEALPAKVIDDLAPALQAGILREPRPAQFSFSHILVRDAIEAALAAAERLELHARAERALSPLGDGPEVLVERARHALAALGPDGAGLQLGLRAAELLEELGAFDRAYAMRLRIAEARAHVLGRPAEPGEQLQLARLAQAAGRYGEARQLCNEVLLRARAARDAELLARAALTLGSELRPGTVDRELLAALERARAELADAGTPGGAHALLGCRVLARLSAVLQPAKDPQMPVALALQAIAQARASGDEATLLEVLHVAGSALVDYAPIELRRQHNQELLARARARADLPRQLAALGRLAMDQAEYGEFTAWEGSVDRLLELASAVGTPRLRWRALLFGSMRAVAKGEVLESERLLSEVRELGELTDDPALVLSLSAHVALRAALLHLDDPIELLVPLRGLEDVPYGEVVHLILKARAHARLEDEPNARRALEQLPPCDPRLPPEWLGWLVEPCVLAGDLVRCRMLRAALERRAAPQFVGGHVPITYEGPVARLLGLLDSALGEAAAAEQKLRAALAQMEQHGLAAWVAQLRYDLAGVLARAGRHAEARALFAETAQRAERLGMRGLHARAQLRSLDPGAAAGAPSARASSAHAALLSSPPAPRAPLRMSREGDVWLVQHGARSARVKHSRGIALLARLVERPGEDIHVLALSSDEAGASLQDTRVSGLDAPDPRALREYKQRLSELAEELAEAQQAGDSGRAGRLQREQQLLQAELSRALGLGGGRATGPAERARVNVQRRLKDAIARLAECDAELGRYLEKAVVTGTYCRFLA